MSQRLENIIYELQGTFVYDYDFETSCLMRAFSMGNILGEWKRLVTELSWLKRNHPTNYFAMEHATIYLKVLHDLLAKEDECWEPVEEILGSQDTYSEVCSEHSSDRDFVVQDMLETTYENDGMQVTVPFPTPDMTRETLKYQLEAISGRFDRWKATVIHSWQLGKLSNWVTFLEGCTERYNEYQFNEEVREQMWEKQMLQAAACPLDEAPVYDHLVYLRGGEESEIDNLLRPYEK